MNNLIKIELKKIFCKKSIYIIWFLMSAFCILNNILYKTDYDEYGNYKYLEKENLNNEEEQLKEELKKYNKDNQNEVNMYVTIKTKLDIIDLKKNFADSTWQYNKLDKYLYEILYQLNNYQYSKKDIIKYNELNLTFQNILEKLKKDNWKYFLEIEQQKLEQDINNLTEQEKLITDKKEKIELNHEIEYKKNDLQIIKYRIKNNIKEDNSYLNNALENYQTNYKIVKYYQDKKIKRTHQEEIEYINSLSEMNINQYILKNKKNINRENNLNYQLRTIIEDYEIFLVILILIISGTIVSEEFKDGTIKLLLIKPYSRCKILLSKYLTVGIVVTFSILYLIILQLLIGGLIFGLDSLKLPVVIYHFKQSQIIEFNVFYYMIIRILVRVPFLLMLISISIFISVISNSSIISNMFTLMIYMFSPIIKELTIQYHLNFMKYSVNINWDLQTFLFGSLNENPLIQLKFSIIILIVYFVILWILTFSIFQKKNIKNI